MEIRVPTNNELEKFIAESFNIFDRFGDGFIESNEVGNVLRFMGCVPTEEEIKQIIAETKSDAWDGDVSLVKFLPYVSQLLMERKMEPASEEKLLAAFETLDPELTGFVSKAYISELMREEGECFTQEELDSMLSVAIDPTIGKLPYEFYLNQLKHHPQKSVYNIAETVLIEQEKKSQTKARYINESDTYENDTKRSFFNAEPNLK